MKIAEEKMRVVRNAIRMGENLSLENENLPIREIAAQVIISSAVTQTQFQHRPRSVGD